jgi:phenylpropionate dioxygenase-like ring-hydroxylating dioxygenase large terminal subunit
MDTQMPQHLSDPSHHDTSAKPEPVSFGTGFLYDSWWFAALSQDLKPGKLARFMLLNQPVLLGRDLDDKVYALRDICPHRAAPLSAGQMLRDEATGACVVQCPYHGWQFQASGDKAGACRKIPSLTPEQTMDTDRIRTPAYSVTEQQGLVFVYIPKDPRRYAPPTSVPPLLPGVVGGKPLMVDTMVFDAHIDHCVVGLMDPAHGPYVHQQWWWRSSKKQLEKSKTFAPRDYGFAMVRHAPSKNSRAYRILGGAPATEITFRLPGIRYEHIEIGDKQILALTCLTPLGPNSTKITQIFWSDHRVFRLISPLFQLGAKAFLRQDGDMVNLQNMGLNYDPSLLWIDDADTQAKWYLKLKREWVAHLYEDRAFNNPVPQTKLSWVS